MPLVVRSSPDAVPLVPVAVHGSPGHNRWGGDTTPCEDTRGTMNCLLTSAQVLLQCVVFKCRCEKCNKDQL